ncbi:hybrid sensor histidine kinase/response regulator [Chitinophaga japonensis]|uniref:histidine kinase n=1 Tax=Chitinophaga japonensis TaxID=104662 RepID=A0A562SKY4_CHIJA|nr:two-component regulator propeller domain-containing protein [Chitinophaga japonensis]TWI81965.1 two component regulator with propeller domain [Chitinophaga japonensis]
MQSLKCLFAICSRLLLLSFPFTAFASNGPAPDTRTINNGLCLEQLTTHDGLSQNTVRCLLQDKKGFIWIGTLNGLNRYDGKKFIIYRPAYGHPHSITDARIRELHEDRYGFIWVKTFDGRIHCFDPAREEFIPYAGQAEPPAYDQVYQDSRGDTWLYGHTGGCLRIRREGHAFTAKQYALPGQRLVNFIFEDAMHYLWLGTTNGLYRLDPQGRVRGAFGQAAAGQQRHDFIQAVAGREQLYFVSRQSGIYSFNIAQQHFGALRMERPMPLTGAALLQEGQLLLGTPQSGAWVLHTHSGRVLPASTVFGEAIPGPADLVSDTLGVWVNNHSGQVWYYDLRQQYTRRFTLIPPRVMQLIDDGRLTFHRDRQQRTWITTYGGGLYCYNRHTDTLQHFSYATDRANGLSSNYLLSVLVDRSGLIWAGTEHTGLNKLMPQSFSISHFYPDTTTPRRYSANIVKTLFEDSRGRIWASTKNGALHLYNSRLEKIGAMGHLFPGQSPNIYCIAEDAKGYLWLGSKGQGLYIVHLDSLQQAARHFSLPATAGDRSNKHNLVYALLPDRQQRMWVGTFGAGLYQASYGGGQAIHFSSFFSGHETLKDIRCLLQDREGQIWAGTNNGLLAFDPAALLQDRRAFRAYRSDPAQPNGLGSNVIKILCEDRQGRLWVGTSGGGISRFVPGKGEQAGHFQTYTAQQGLSHDIVNGILEDGQGELWISTENGLTRFNPDQHTFEIFYFSNSTLGNLFAEAACCRRRNGQQLWGSMDGFYSCHPSLMRSRRHDAPVVLTGFSIAGHPAPLPAGSEPAITLAPGQKVFSIEFAALAFRNPQRNKYTYILENYEDAWNAPGSYNVATYRNLPPGTYTFRVKGSNDDGSWSRQEAALRITVLPPFWRSRPAILLYLCLAGGLAAGIYLVRRRIFRLQHAVALEKELTEYKLNFFTNISHEFRTPLSLILSAMEHLPGGRSGALQAGRHLHIMQKNVQRLMRLADQLLDFRKIQHQRMPLQVQEVAVIALLQELCDNFNDLAEQQHIHLVFESNVPEYHLWIDEPKLDKMLYNLLSNAHKFTPAGGTITVRAEVDEAAGTLQVHVSDTGISIPESRREQVFQRFSQLSFSPTGTGIGLSLTRELAMLHKGSVTFRNNPDAGVTFTLTLPLFKTAYTAAELAAPADSSTGSSPLQPGYIADTEGITLPAPATRYKVLLIEDHPDICDYLGEQLGPYFQVQTAHNGREGLALAIAGSPDLVVCDVMLPEMNGFEITRRIRQEFQTCHIPIVLLTALCSDEHHLQGVDAGADAYITKPFSTRLLLTRIIRLIEQREKIRKRFSNDPGFFEVHITEQAADRSFLDRLHLVIEKNLDNTQFSVDEFAAAMKLGRTLFYKKVKGLTGYSPNEYIRLVRLKQAATLLQTGDYTVAEVTYKVGMNDPFYFSKCFKAQFGIPPSAYLKQVKAG